MANLIDTNVYGNLEVTGNIEVEGTVDGHDIDSELDTLNGRVNQGVRTIDSPTFANFKTATYTTSVDLNTIITNGFYYVAPGVNSPAVDICSLLVVGDADVKSQTLIEIGTNNYWHRIGRLVGNPGETWTSWRQL